MEEYIEQVEVQEWQDVPQDSVPDDLVGIHQQ